MPPSSPQEPDPRQSLLGSIRVLTGVAPRILLPGPDSEPGSSPLAVDPSNATAKLVPQGRGNYRLLGEIARGGMGVILKGHDTDLGRDVAVKVLDAEQAKVPASVQRFVEEAQIGGQLQHPGIVPVYELGLMAGDVPYFTMKLVKGRTLAALLRERRSPAENRGRLISIFESVCQTVAYAHSRGVLHRDLKPANVMVGAFGEVQVVDWGLAKVLHRGGGGEEKRADDGLRTVIETVRSASGSSVSDSIAGLVMGTPAYMAPEQAQGEIEKLDERADVFSLGAILCEILTASPPYEARDNEPTIVQAARANLDPARRWVRECGADPGLVKLCLDCLMTGRDARPANAEEVAKAVHAYLTSTEERAQKAEIAAAAAQVKAAEERRARRLTVALGGAIAVAVLVTGGSLYWIEREETRRAERTREAVDAAQGESIAFEQDGRHEEALAAARRALSLAAAGGAEAALIDRVEGFVAKAELVVEEAARERAVALQNESLIGRIGQLRLDLYKSFGVARTERALDAQFVQAFRDCGIDVEADDLVPAVERCRQGGIAEEVAFTLDFWGRLRRRVHGTNSRQAENLILLAMDLDPHPLRVDLRRAIADNDLPTLLRLGAPENVPKLGPGSTVALSLAIVERHPEQGPAAQRMVFLAKDLFPSDYNVQIACREFYLGLGRVEASLTCAMAALSLRPDDPTTRAYAAESLLLLGRLTDAADIIRRCVAEHPSHAHARWVFGRTQILLGDHAGALENLTRSLDLDDVAERRADLLVARFFNGLASTEEVEQGLSVESLISGMGTLMFALVDHPDRAQRDPEHVLRAIATLGETIGKEEWRYLVEALAKAALEDWSGALAVIQDRITPWKMSVVGLPLGMPLGAYDFFRATVYSRAGRADTALECYRRGMATWNELAGSDPAAWERSDVMRWRREAEAALGR